jgi:hypothetical protein
MLTQKQLNKAITGLANQYNLTGEACSGIYKGLTPLLQKSPILIPQFAQSIESSTDGLAQFDRNLKQEHATWLSKRTERLPDPSYANIFEQKRRVLLTPPPFTNISNPQSYDDIPAFMKYQGARSPFRGMGNSFQLPGSQDYTQLKNQFDTNKALRLQSSAESASSLGSILNPFAMLNFGQNGNIAKWNELKKTPEGRAALNQAKGALASKGLMAGLIVPMIADSISAAIGTESLGQRRAGAGVEAIGQIGSYAGTGAIFGPEGAAIGAVVGAGIGISKVIGSWNDILPDLQRNLDRIKDSTRASSDAINNYISISNKLNDIYSGQLTGVSKGNVRELELQQRQSLLQIPDTSSRNKLSSLVRGGNLSGAQDFQNILNQQGQNALGIAGLTQQLASPNTITSQQKAFGGYSEPTFKQKASDIILGGFSRGIDNILGEGGKLLHFSGFKDFKPEFLDSSPNTNQNKELLLNQAIRDQQIQSVGGGISQLLIGMQNQSGKSIFDLFKDKNTSDQFGKFTNINDFFGAMTKIAGQNQISTSGINSLSVGINAGLQNGNLDANAVSLILQQLNGLFSTKGFAKFQSDLSDMETAGKNTAAALKELQDILDKSRDNFEKLKDSL